MPLRYTLAALAAVFALSLIAPASAQEVVEDTTSAWRYFPLHVGNAWEYAGVFDLDGPQPPESFTLTRLIRKDTLVGQQDYVVVETRRYDDDGATIEISRRLVRFDTTSSTVVYRGYAGGSEQPEVCPLDLPFGLAYTGEELCRWYLALWTEGGYDQPITIGDETLVRTYKEIHTSSAVDMYSAYAADVGILAFGWGEAGTGSTHTLVTARIQDEVYGDPPSTRFPGIPDPVDPARYAPLATGDEWHYRWEGAQTFEEGWTYRHVVRDDSLRNGRTYAVVRDSTFSRTPEGSIVFNGTTDLLWRWAPDLGRVMDGSPPEEVPASPWLDAGFGTYEDDLWSGPFAVDSLETPYGIAKSFGGLQGFAYVPDIGLVQETGDFYVQSLEYYRVGGAEGGAPLVVVAGEEQPERIALSLTARPNPATDRLALALVGGFRQPGSAVRVSVFDARGRRVLDREVVGDGELSLDVRDWSPGVYLARADAGGDLATARFVVH